MAVAGSKTDWKSDNINRCKDISRRHSRKITKMFKGEVLQRRFDVHRMNLPPLRDMDIYIYI